MHVAVKVTAGQCWISAIAHKAKSKLHTIESCCTRSSAWLISTLMAIARTTDANIGRREVKYHGDDLADNDDYKEEG
jgi:hypothetical protein